MDGANGNMRLQYLILIPTRYGAICVCEASAVMLSSFALTSLGSFMISSFPPVHFIKIHKAWYYLWMIAAMSTKQARFQVLNCSLLKLRTILFILTTHQSKSVRFFDDWPTPGDKFVNDDALNKDKGADEGQS